MHIPDRVVISNIPNTSYIYVEITKNEIVSHPKIIKQFDNLQDALDWIKKRW